MEDYTFAKKDFKSSIKSYTYRYLEPTEMLEGIRYICTGLPDVA